MLMYNLCISGGPLSVLDNGRYYLLGITSAGFDCAKPLQPGIYHNVSELPGRGLMTHQVNLNFHSQQVQKTYKWIQSIIYNNS